MQKKVVILGGVGLIGTHLCKKILDRGDQVYCVDTRELSASPLLRDWEQHGNLHYVRHNVVSPFTIRCDEIYNLCARPAQLRPAAARRGLQNLPPRFDQHARKRPCGVRQGGLRIVERRL